MTVLVSTNTVKIDKSVAVKIVAIYSRYTTVTVHIGLFAYYRPLDYHNSCQKEEERRRINTGSSFYY